MDRHIDQKVSAFFSTFKPTAYKKGEVIVQAGDNPSSVFYLEEGLVKEYAVSRKGDDIILNIYKPHTFFSMSWVIADVGNTHYYEALTDVVVRKVSKREVLEFIKKEPEVSLDLLRRVYVGIDGMFKHVEYLISGDAYAKLLVSLYIFAKRFGKVYEDGVHIDLKMSEKDLASYAGLARETVSREFTKLAQKKLIVLKDHHVIIKDLKKLQDELSNLEQ